MEYVQFAAPPHLASWIECVWRLCGEADPETPHRIFPDGSLELVIHTRRPPSQRTDDGRLERQGPRLVVGQMLSAVTLVADEALDVWGVRVHPWGGRVFFEGPASHLTGRIESANDVNPALVHELQRVIEDEGAERARLEGVWRVLARRVNRLAPLDALAAHVSRHLLHAPAARSLEQLARESGVSGRQLERRFLSSVGLTPKMFARIARFQRVFAALDGPSDTLSTVALDCGYYDQSHLARDVRDFAGDTPASLRNLDSSLAERFLRARRMSGFSKIGADDVE